MAGHRPRRHETGQHFLAGRHLAERIAARAGVTSDDFVVEIGSGPGLLTEALAARAGRVHAIELDPALAERSRRRVRDHRNVRVVHADARTAPLPREPFRVVASLPFSSTTAILRRLLDDPRGPMRRADVVVQWEVARKRAGEGGAGSLLSAYWGAWFEFTLAYRLPAASFSPPPRVDAAMLTITRRQPLVRPADHARLLALIAAGFERANLPLERALAGHLGRGQRRALRRGLPRLADLPAPALAAADWAAVLAVCEPDAGTAPSGPARPVKGRPAAANETRRPQRPDRRQGPSRRPRRGQR